MDHHPILESQFRKMGGSRRPPRDARILRPAARLLRLRLGAAGDLVAGFLPRLHRARMIRHPGVAEPHEFVAGLAEEQTPSSG